MSVNGLNDFSETNRDQLASHVLLWFSSFFLLSLLGSYNTVSRVLITYSRVSDDTGGKDVY